MARKHRVPRLQPSLIHLAPAVDSSYYENIVTRAVDNKTVPSALLYWSIRGAALWLRYAQKESRSYSARRHVHDRFLPLVANEIAQHLERYPVANTRPPAVEGSIPSSSTPASTPSSAPETDAPQLHVLSLGPGDGIHDLVLLAHLRQDVKNLRIWYDALDISLHLLQSTLGQLQNRKRWPADLWDPTLRQRTRLITGDLNRIAALYKRPSWQVPPKLISFLGATLGNLPRDDKLLQALAQMMNPGDLLLLGVDLWEHPYNAAEPPDRATVYKNLTRLYSGLSSGEDFLCGPLVDLQVVRTDRPTPVWSEDRDRRSPIVNPCTIYHSYDTPDGDQYELSMSRKYSYEGLLSFLHTCGMQPIADPWLSPPSAAGITHVFDSAIPEYSLLLFKKCTQQPENESGASAIDRHDAVGQCLKSLEAFWTDILSGHANDTVIRDYGRQYSSLRDYLLTDPPTPAVYGYCSAFVGAKQAWTLTEFEVALAAMRQE